MLRHPTFKVVAIILAIIVVLLVISTVVAAIDDLSNGEDTTPTSLVQPTSTAIPTPLPPVPTSTPSPTATATPTPSPTPSPTPTTLPPLPTPSDSAKRWVEQFDVHWPNVDAFKASLDSIFQDNVISKEESTHVCFVLEQWIDQMTAARDYVIEYERVEPDTVNATVRALKKEAELALDLLNQIECE